MALLFHDKVLHLLTQVPQVSLLYLRKKKKSILLNVSS